MIQLYEPPRSGKTYTALRRGPATVWQECCHSRMYFQGPARFWSALRVDAFDLARRLWILSGERPMGESLIRQARRGIASRQAPFTHRRVKAWSQQTLPAEANP